MTSLGSAPPATLTRMSIFPSRSNVTRTISCTDFLLVTSTAILKAWLPCPVISATRCWALSGLMSATAIFAPRWAKWRAMAPPIPPPPPVTMATLSFSSVMTDFSTKALDSSDKRQHLVQVLNSADPGVAERLIIWPMGHEHDSVGVFGHIAAVLVPIVDKQVDFEFPDQLRLEALGEVNNGIADAMFFEPGTSDLVDTVIIALISVCNEDELLLAAQAV